jgi:hypothetical protein
MSSQRTAWHLHFTLGLRSGKCEWVDVRDEVALSEERPRMDYIFMRRTHDPSPGDTGKTLKRMWPLIPKEAVAEFKSIGGPYRHRSLDRLWSYLHAYYADTPRLAKHADLIGILILPCRTRTLDEDVAEMGLEYLDMTEGYWEITGGLFRMYVVEIDVVGETEPDGVLKSFGHCNKLTDEAYQFWANQLGMKELAMKEGTVDPTKLEGHKEIVARFLANVPPQERLAGIAPQELLAQIPAEMRLAGLAPQERLAGLAPQERLAGLAPQERLAGLTRDEMLLALPDDELRRLPESYLDTFSAAVRETVRKRLAK